MKHERPSFCLFWLVCKTILSQKRKNIVQQCWGVLRDGHSSEISGTRISESFLSRNCAAVSQLRKPTLRSLVYIRSPASVTAAVTCCGLSNGAPRWRQFRVTLNHVPEGLAHNTVHKPFWWFCELPSPLINFCPSSSIWSSFCTLDPQNLIILDWNLSPSTSIYSPPPPPPAPDNGHCTVFL